MDFSLPKNIFNAFHFFYFCRGFYFKNLSLRVKLQIDGNKKIRGLNFSALKMFVCAHKQLSLLGVRWQQGEFSASVLHLDRASLNFGVIDWWGVIFQCSLLIVAVRLPYNYIGALRRRQRALIHCVQENKTPLFVSDSSHCQMTKKIAPCVLIRMRRLSRGVTQRCLIRAPCVFVCAYVLLCTRQWAVTQLDACQFTGWVTRWTCMTMGLFVGLLGIY